MHAASLLLLMFIGPVSAYAGQSLPRILILGVGSQGTALPQVRGLYDGLEEAGYVDGKNILIRHVKGEREEELRSHLNAALKQRVDLIVATSANETAIARQFVRDIPIVFVPAVDPVGMGFVRSLAQPDDNLTGLSFTRGVEDNAKQLAVFKQLVPHLKKALMFYDDRSGTGAPPAMIQAVNRAASDLQIQLTPYPVNSAGQAAQALSRTSRTADGVFVICSGTFRDIAVLAAEATKKRLPLFGCTASQVAEEGALMTYTPDIYYIGYRGAWYVDRLVRGSKPQHLPVESPARFEFVVNLKTARRINLTIPPETLILVDKVF
jgi:putative tryptophan/tyrosine transport system substrate-binding protein